MGHLWTETVITKLQKQVESQVALLQQNHGPQNCWASILERIHVLEQSTHAEDILQLFFYLLAALKLYVEDHTLLAHSEARRMVVLARKILQLQFKQQRYGKLGQLHGALLWLESQIYSHQGQHWQSAWSLAMSHSLAKDTDQSALVARNLAAGQKAMRLGHLPSALRYFHNMSQIANQAEQTKVWLLMAECFLLRQVPKLFDDACDKVLAGQDLITSEDKQELEWLLAVSQFLDHRDLSQLLRLVRRKRSHFASRYLLEVSLWGLSVKSREWLDRLPKPANIKRWRDISVRKDDPLVAVVQAVQNMYDLERPLAVRLNDLAAIMPKLSQLEFIRHELLAYLAIARGLIRARQYPLARLVMAEYYNKSLLLSGGRSRDVYGLLTEEDARTLQEIA